MSTIATNTITNVAGNATGVGIAVSNASTYNSEGGAVTQNLVQGLCKVWVSYEQDDDASPGNTIHGSFNVSSQTDSAQGKTITNFSNNFANAGYSFAGQVFDGGGYNDARTLNHDRDNDQYTTSGLGYYNWIGSSLDDAFRYFGQFMGDLA